MSEADAALATLDPGSALPPHLLRMFLRAGSEQLADLVAKCERRDTEAARAQAHKLKGGLYAVGASRLAEALETLRSVLSASDWPAAIHELSRIRAAFDGLMSELERRSRAGTP